MRSLSTAFVLAVVATVPAFAQGSRGAPPPRFETQTRSRVPQTNTMSSSAPIKLEDQWTSALVRRDASTFQRLLAPNFVYTEDAAVMSRGAWSQQWRSWRQWHAAPAAGAGRLIARAPSHRRHRLQQPELLRCPARESRWRTPGLLASGRCRRGTTRARDTVSCLRLHRG